MSNELVERIAGVLRDAGWRDAGDAQWTRLEAALPDLRDALAAHQERDALREALEQFGVHDEDCRRRRGRHMSCDCGLTAALSPAEPNKET